MTRDSFVHPHLHTEYLVVGWQYPDERAKGYEVADFREAFERYLPREEGDSIRDSVTNEGESDSGIRDKSENVTDAEIPF
jgi:hypothetical protein